jgi:hypothetical protein
MFPFQYMLRNLRACTMFSFEYVEECLCWYDVIVLFVWCAGLPFGQIHFQKPHFCGGVMVSPSRSPFSEISLLWRCAGLPCGRLHFEKSHFCGGVLVSLSGECILRNLTFVELCWSPLWGNPFSEISLLWRCVGVPSGESIFRNLTFVEVCCSPLWRNPFSEISLLWRCAGLPFGKIHFQKSYLCGGVLVSPSGDPCLEIWLVAAT